MRKERLFRDMRALLERMYAEYYEFGDKSLYYLIGDYENLLSDNCIMKGLDIREVEKFYKD